MSVEPSDMPCLVTEGRRATSVARALSRESVRVFGADTQKPLLGLRPPWMERLIVYPRFDRPEETVNSLLDIVQRTGSQVLMSISTDTTRLIVSNAPHFTGAVKFLFPGEDALNTAFDKLASIEAARRAGVPVPQTRPFQDPADLDDFPMVSKPRYETGGATAVRIIQTRDDAEKAYADSGKFGPLLLQEYVPGTSRQMRTCDLLYDSRSELKAVFCMAKIREHLTTGGVTLAGVSIWDPDLAGLAERLVSSISWRGVAEVEFKIDPRDGRPKLMEINPRFWAYVWLPVACGVNFPHLLYRLCIGEDFEPVKRYRTGVGYVNAGLRPMTSMASLLQVPKIGGIVFDHLPPRDPALLDLILKTVGKWARLTKPRKKRGPDGTQRRAQLG